MLTLAELLSRLNPPAAGPAREPDELDRLFAERGARAYPFWLVVVNPRRVPAEPKFVNGFRTEPEAEADRARRQDEADREADAETNRRSTLSPPGPPFEPFRFYVVARPDDWEVRT